MMAKDQLVAIVTGAGSGIGKAASLSLAEAGFDIVMVGRTQSKLEAAADQVTAAHPRRQAVIIAADLAEASNAARIVDRALADMGRVDALINNAAIGLMADLARIDEPMLRDTFAANVFGPALLIAHLWPHFEKNAGGGVVVNVSSMATIDPFPGLGVYAASKAALESLTRSIVTEGRSHSIRAFSIAPDAVETPMLRGLFSTESFPTARTLDPSVVAGVIVECVIGRRDHQVGQTIVLPSP